MNKILKFFTYANEGMGRVAWFLIFTMMALGVYDVIMRYLFAMPTHWVYLVNKAGMVALACFAGGYALHAGSFVKVDVLYSHFPPRAKAITDTFTFALTALFCVIAIWMGIEEAQWSIKIQRLTPSHPYQLPLYIIQPLVPLGALILLLVSVRKLVTDIGILFGKGKSQADIESDS